MEAMAAKKSYDYLFKVLLIGDPGVEKNAILFRFSDDAFKSTFLWTIGEISVVLTTCLDTRQPGTVFKKLDTRQSEILTNFLEIARLIPLRT